MGPKVNHKCLYKRQAEGDVTHAEEKEGMQPQRQRWECSSHKLRATVSHHHKLKEAIN